jgi:hypothetical protein
VKQDIQVYFVYKIADLHITVGRAGKIAKKYNIKVYSCRRGKCRNVNEAG